MRDQGRVDELPALLRESDEGAAAIGRVRATLDQAGILQPVESLRHAPRREHRRRHQLSGVQLERRAGPSERREEVEPPWLQIVPGDPSAELGVRELCGAKQTSHDSECGDVDVRSLPLPLREDPVHVIRLAFSLTRHGRSILPAMYLASKIHAAVKTTEEATWKTRR